MKNLTLSLVYRIYITYFFNIPFVMVLHFKFSEDKLVLKLIKVKSRFSFYKKLSCENVCITEEFT